MVKMLWCMISTAFVGKPISEGEIDIGNIFTVVAVLRVYQSSWPFSHAYCTTHRLDWVRVLSCRFYSARRRAEGIFCSRCFFLDRPYDKFYLVLDKDALNGEIDVEKRYHRGPRSKMFACCYSSEVAKLRQHDLSGIVCRGFAVLEEVKIYKTDWCAESFCVFISRSVIHERYIGAT